ncbi:MAG: peptide deformylase [bacterium]|jgi:peptide deformylase|nr:peptide deformylase [bacterium]
MEELRDLEIRLIGDPVLRRRAQPVTEFGPPLRDLAEQMYEIMVDAVGIGLAAPQVGLSIRFLVVGVPVDEGEGLKLMAFANPRIVEQEGRCVMEEGCLSIPEIREEVERPERIRVHWQDLDGAGQEAWFEDLEARVILHEMDHLEGVLFVDRISPARRATLKRRLAQVGRRGNL